MAKLDYVKEAVVKRNPNDAEFIQAVDEVLLSLEKVAGKHPELYRKRRIRKNRRTGAPDHLPCTLG